MRFAQKSYFYLGPISANTIYVHFLGIKSICCRVASRCAIASSILFSFLCLSNSSFSQIILTGLVTDTAKSPIEFVTIQVFESSVLRKTLVTDSSGRFSYKVDQSKFIKLDLSRTGYKSKSFSFTLNTDTLVSFSMDQSKVDLAGVDIKVEKPVLEKQGDKFVFNPKATSVPKELSIWDILGITPLVATTEQGGISINGVTGVIVLINERRTYLTGEALMNYLRGQPSENLIKIEISTMPSSKYDAQGGAGILNLVIKRNTLGGINGSVAGSSKQTTYNSQTIDGNLTGKFGKLGFYTNLSIANRNLLFTGSNETSVYTSSQSYSSNNQFQRRLRDKREFVPNFGIDYDVSRKGVLGLLVEYSTTSLTRYSTTKSQFYELSSIIDSNYETRIRNFEATKFLNSNIYYSLQTDTLGGKLKVNFDNLYYSDTRETLQSTYLVDSQFNSIILRDFFTSFLPQKISNNSVSFDFSRFYSKSTVLEVGTKYTNSKTDNDILFQIPGSSDLVYDSSRSNYFKYNEAIFSMYVTYETLFRNRVNIKFGGRVEQTKVQGYLVNTGEKNNSSYLNIFPTLFINLKSKGKHQMSFALTSRINRPSFWDINPFRYYISNTIYTTGNPTLLPSKIFRQEFTYNYRGKLVCQLTYSVTSNAFAMLNYLNGDTVYQKQTNYGRKTQFGLSANYSGRLFSFWFLRVNANAGIASFKGIYDKSTVIDNRSLLSSVDLFSAFTLSKKGKMYGTISASNSFPTYAENTRIGNQFRLNIWFSKTSKNDRTVLSLGFSDVFRTTIDRYFTVQEGQDFKENYYYDSRGLSISLRYKFGKSIGQPKDLRTTSNNDEKGRIK